jgi:alanyl-tRNA synthetase
MMTSKQIRQAFIDFFVQRSHTYVPSASSVPTDDPTLMFTNAGMNQFKDVFLGIGSRPYTRAVDTQKCIRVSGKHNDLEEVGRDGYHHTFFEMLGNWSFGDYFKQEAIAWAWELFTKVYGFEKDRLHATVFVGDEAEGLEPDEEAANLWRTLTDIDPSHIHWGSKKDNFWEMGATGPCGPNSEIHIDLTPDKSGKDLVNKGDPRVMELWNLVFMQFNRGADGKLTPLPAKHIDTGAGFERICRVMQGVQSNYDTDVFTPIMDQIAQLTGQKYTASFESIVDTAFRVIADHIRMLTISITDGARPSNDGRGYVLRRILRRAARFGRQYLNTTEPFIYKLVPTVADVLGGAFPDVKQAVNRVSDIVRDEEASFGRTLDRGMKLFFDAVETTKAANARLIPGSVAFRLYDEAGFPVDLTRQMAEENGLGVDEAEFDRLMQEKKQKDRAATKGKMAGIQAFDVQLPPTNDRDKWSKLVSEGKVLGWTFGGKFVTQGQLDETKGQVGLVLDRTCFYAEAGGQVGDIGTITSSSGTFEVDDTVKMGDAVVHLGKVGDGRLEVGQLCELQVEGIRQQTARHHTATHLLHWALRKVLGEHVEQKGSLVDPERLRFDLDHPQALTAAEIAEIERLVNEKIYQDFPVQWCEMAIAEAKQLPGLRALFGEKYGETVRVVEVGEGFSRELCGGTHLERTGQAGPFVIVSEEAVGKGVRRITALAGEAAVLHIQKTRDVVSQVASELRCSPEDVPARLKSLQEQAQTLRKQLAKGASQDLKGATEDLIGGAERVNGAAVIVGELPNADPARLREVLDVMRNKATSAAILVGVKGDEGKVVLLSAMTDDLVKKGLHAGNVVKMAAGIVGGRGGGKPDMAQAGGNLPEKLGEALAAGKAEIMEKLAAGN